MLRSRLITAGVVAAIGMAAFLAGWYGFTQLETVPKTQTISGGQVADLTTCSKGYANGTCTTSAFDWSGTLVSDTGGSFSDISRVWGMHAGDVSNFPTTCGLHATYKTNIPVSALGPRYLPLGSGVIGEVFSGSTAYVFTAGTYSEADKCEISSASSVSNPATRISISYTLNGLTTSFTGASYGYDFAPNDDFTAGMLAGLFILGLGWGLSVVDNASGVPDLSAGDEPAMEVGIRPA